MQATPNPNMIYRYLGNTGTKVSVLSYGNYVNNNVITQEIQDESDAVI